MSLFFTPRERILETFFEVRLHVSRINSWRWGERVDEIEDRSKKPQPVGGRIELRENEKMHKYQQQILKPKKLFAHSNPFPISVSYERTSHTTTMFSTLCCTSRLHAPSQEVNANEKFVHYLCTYRKNRERDDWIFDLTNLLNSKPQIPKYGKVLTFSFEMQPNNGKSPKWIHLQSLSMVESECHCAIERRKKLLCELRWELRDEMCFEKHINL